MLESNKQATSFKINYQLYLLEYSIRIGAYETISNRPWTEFRKGRTMHPR